MAKQTLLARYRNLPDLTALGGTLAAILSGFLLWHGGVFWAGSVSQVHAVCSAAGPLVALGGMHAVTACSDAGTAYFLLLAALVISALVAIGGFVWLAVIRRSHA